MMPKIVMTILGIASTSSADIFAVVPNNFAPASEPQLSAAEVAGVGSNTDHRTPTIDHRTPWVTFSKTGRELRKHLTMGDFQQDWTRTTSQSLGCVGVGGVSAHFRGTEPNPD
jgi:hypothetical protein